MLAGRLSELDEALARAIQQVVRAFSPRPEELASMLALFTGQGSGVSRVVAIDILLEQVEDLINAALYDACDAQEGGCLDVHFEELAAMRRRVSAFSCHASYLVQPRLAPAAWRNGRASLSTHH